MSNTKDISAVAQALESGDIEMKGAMAHDESVMPKATVIDNETLAQEGDDAAKALEG